jgi:hypothetical protein
VSGEHASRYPGSNWGPLPYQESALPPELYRHAYSETVFSRKQSQQEPRGVRVVRAGLPTIECDLIRDEDGDTSGCAAWFAVPREEFALRAHRDHLEVDFLPGKTIINFTLKLPPD